MKLMLLFSRKPGMSFDEFRDHYETKHAPMSLRILPFFKSYTRNYVRQREAYQPGDDGVARPRPDFDVATEIRFASKSDFDRMIAAFAEPAIWKQIDEDMDKFVDRSKSRTFIVDEVDTPAELLPPA